MSAEHLWVIGRSGMLGSALARAHVDAVHFEGNRVPWADTSAASEVLSDDLVRFKATVGSQPWSILWSAGAGVIGTSSERLDRETSIVEAFAYALAHHLPAGPGAMFFASSASVYAGGRAGPFTEASRVAPTSSYATAKITQEQILRAVLGAHLPVVIGRIATLYGRGQDLSKPQGLVSRMCLQAIRRAPVQLYVPLDTLRDYVYIDDAAQAIRQLVEHARNDGAVGARIRNISTGQASSLAAVAATVRVICHRPVGIRQVAAPTPPGHVRDLRVDTLHATETAGAYRTSLVVGVHSVYQDIMQELARGAIHAG